MLESMYISIEYTLCSWWSFCSLVGNARKNQDGVVSNSLVYFSSNVPVNTLVGGPEPLKLKRILDMVSPRLSHFFNPFLFSSIHSFLVVV